LELGPKQDPGTKLLPQAREGKRIFVYQWKEGKSTVVVQDPSEQVTDQTKAKYAEWIESTFLFIAGLEEWIERLTNWKSRYQEKRREVKAAPQLDKKLALLAEIHKRMSKEEMQKIQEIEAAQGPSPYPLFKEWDPVGWREGFREDPKAQWDEASVSSYYYHGTSLGSALVAVKRGSLGGVPELSEWLEIQDEFKVEGAYRMIPGASYLLAPEDYPEQGRTDLGRLIYEATRFSDRVIRPAQAVLIYYALRALWEKEGRKGSFPPIDYFFQRAVLRIPKEDVQGIESREEGPGGFKEHWTTRPIPFKRAEILVDEDIPIPKRPFHLRGVGLSDPENIWYRPYYPELPSDWDEVRLEEWQLDNQGFVSDTYERRNAIGNKVMNSWRSVDKLLSPTAGLEEGAQVVAVEELYRREPRLDGTIPVAVKEVLMLPAGGVPAKPEAQEVILYTHPTVAMAASLLLPDQWRGKIERIPLDDPGSANALLEQARKDFQDGQPVFIALDARFTQKLDMENLPLTFLLDPQRWDRLMEELVAGDIRAEMDSLFLLPRNALVNRILDLTEGSVRREKIQGRDWILIYV